MAEYLSIHWLDITTTILGIAYIVLEYRASILLWIIGIVMPAMDIYLYWSHGLYGDAGMAVYYTVAAIYGYAVWKFGRKSKATSEDKATSEMPITHFPKRLILKTTAAFFLAWGATYYVLKEYTGSTVPMLDAFTNAMSFVGLWHSPASMLNNGCSGLPWTPSVVISTSLRAFPSRLDFMVCMSL